MLDLFRGEVYRLFHKRNMYLYLGAVMLGYVGLVFMRSGGFNQASVFDDANTMFSFLPALLGGYFFTSLYSDDLTAKNLITLVGYGTSRAKIVLTKLALMTVFTVVSFAIFTAIHFGIYTVLGFAATGPVIGYVLAIAFQNILLTVGFALVASIVVYGTQRPTFAAVAYFMLAFNVVKMIFTAISTLANVDIVSHTLSGSAGNIMLQLISGSYAAAPWLEFAGLLTLAIVASVFVFKKKELEF